MIIKGNIIDLDREIIYHGALTIEDGKIKHIEYLTGNSEQYILPGFIDAHVHIESSMLVPSEFARLAVRHGTVATVSDPHEIANVLGVDGVKYMIEEGKQVPLKFHFGAPSCVPATRFETAGAEVTVQEVAELMQHPDIYYLAEMMNFPGVLNDDPEILAKIAAAKQAGKPIDGHAPGLRGKDAKKYIAAGISTDHECFTYEEALEKLQLGMKVIIREGSAAKNFSSLIRLIDEYSEQMMFCSDDKHPDDLIEGHINQLVLRALQLHHPLFKVLRAACVNPVRHYGLNVGLLQVDDPADFIIVDGLDTFQVLATYVDGHCVYDAKQSEANHFPQSRDKVKIINNFNCSLMSPADFNIDIQEGSVRVIKAIDGELITEEELIKVSNLQENAIPSVAADILKIAVVNRYTDQQPAVAFIRNIGLKKGAIASCVAHDSHNIVAVGVNDEAICQAVNLIIKNKGGIAAISDTEAHVLPLPIAGIMSDQDGYTVGKAYAAIDRFAKESLGTHLKAPFMTLSFMALLVIPALKLSDKGLFDVKKFRFTSLFV